MVIAFSAFIAAQKRARLGLLALAWHRRKVRGRSREVANQVRMRARGSSSHGHSMTAMSVADAATAGRPRGLLHRGFVELLRDIHDPRCRSTPAPWPPPRTRMVPLRHRGLAGADRGRNQRRSLGKRGWPCSLAGLPESAMVWERQSSWSGSRPGRELGPPSC